jgi:hypothetical protein
VEFSIRDDNFENAIATDLIYSLNLMQSGRFQDEIFIIVTVEGFGASNS